MWLSSKHLAFFEFAKERGAFKFQGPLKPDPPQNLSSASKKWEIEFGPSRNQNKMSWLEIEITIL